MSTTSLKCEKKNIVEWPLFHVSGMHLMVSDGGISLLLKIVNSKNFDRKSTGRFDCSKMQTVISTFRGMALASTMATNAL